MAGVATATGASPGTETVTPASPPSQPSYLKSYPYLFVRETDQTDYFCTVCEESLKEDQLQSHLFEGHSAENLQVIYLIINPHNSFLHFCFPGLFCSCMSGRSRKNLVCPEKVPVYMCSVLGKNEQYSRHAWTS